MVFCKVDGLEPYIHIVLIKGSLYDPLLEKALHLYLEEKV